MLFRVNFAFGRYTYWTGHGPNSKQQEQKVDGWSLAFTVSFTEHDLTDPKIKEEVQKRISILKPGQYSLTQILISFSAAPLATVDWTSSRLEGLTPDTEKSKGSIFYFKAYMEKYMELRKTGPYSVLGYAIKVPDVIHDIPAPSFPPTGVRCRTQTYSPHTLPQSSPQFDPLRRCTALDVFMFLEMTEGRSFPDKPYKPKTAANWTVATMPASLTLSKRIFWTRYLIPKLQAFNETSLVVANDVYY